MLLAVRKIGVTYLRKGGFELPGGRIEPFESLIQALIREVKEETGLDVYEID
ncbi:NUDIX domain-containing protein [Paenibacillus sp. IHB B 3415]|uniref:NUDIX domain-containing protein n=1 Tax=Paenibacillus sp. IHB B 3415 TaxID=867080 RepID=UPI001F35F463|nr:NUDIX domain-containing protein [Paenibacillus sp. IHB B 3415]